MYKVTVSVITLFLIGNTSSSKVEDTELVLSFITFRHGDKTPLKSYCELVKYKDVLVNLTEPYGFGELTMEGMKKGYAIGKFIKDRYSAFLSPTFDPAEVFVRSTFLSRTIFTVLNAIAAMYNVPQSDWTETMNWTPLPYSTVVPKYDFNGGYVNCPVYVQDLIKLRNKTDPIMEPFMCLRNTLLSETGFDIAKTPLRTFELYDLLTSQEFVGYKLSKRLKNLLPDLKQAADASSSVAFGKSEYIRFLSGVLLNEFFKEVTKVTTYGITPNGITPSGVTPNGTAPSGITPNGTAPSGITPNGIIPKGITPSGITPNGIIPKGITPSGITLDGTAPCGITPNGTAPSGIRPNGIIPNGITLNGITPKFYLYSGHDANLNSFMLATQVTPRQGYPLPGSLFALELRRELLTGKYIVLPFYVSQPGEPIAYLKVDGCGGSFCEFDKFQAITSKYALGINNWRSQCGWNSSMYMSNCIIL